MEKPVLNVHTGMEEIDLRQDKNANGLVQLIAGRHHFRVETTVIRRSGTGPADRRAGRVPSLPMCPIHPPLQPAIPDEGR